MANRKFIHIKSADRDAIEKNLLSVSGSFKLSGREFQNGDIVMNISENVPNYHIFEKYIKKEVNVDVMDRTAVRKKNNDVVREKSPSLKYITELSA